MKPEAPDETDNLSLDPEKKIITKGFFKFIIRN